MERRDLTTFLSYHCLTGRLMTHPVTEMDETVPKLQLKYRTYIVEYDTEDGVVKLPNMFAADFRDKINRLVNLVDRKKNKFEVLVDRIVGSVFLTKGWKAINDFYGLGLGAWVSLVFVPSGRFEMVVKDRFGKAIRCPYFDPPMRCD
uniref:Uncharacterized protein n=1 Tax=Medicago truncatula TaxID=3880 RepID=Q2HSL3_MEDTR|nr:hypothetical protein MtrDRAFT_AC151521g58v2 [Medicago truncatula]